MERLDEFLAPYRVENLRMRSSWVIVWKEVQLLGPRRA
jgi:hypothetical protein